MQKSRVPLALLLAAVLTGCGAGQQAATSDIVSSAPGTLGSVGTIQVRDAQFTWTDPVPGGDAVYEPGDDAVLQVTIVNDATGRVPEPTVDRLVGVSSPIATSGEVVGDATIANGRTLTAGYDAPVAGVVLPGTRAITVRLLGLTEPVRAGQTYPVVFRFAEAGDLRLMVGVENPVVLPPRARNEVEPDEGRLLETGPDIVSEPEEQG